MHYLPALFGALVLFVLPAAAQDYIENGIRGELVAGITDSYDKIVDLAQAIPEDRFAWRPAENVRSVREVLLHVIGSSYYLTKVAGTPYPDGLDLRAMDAELVSKDDVVNSLLDARDHTLDAVVLLDAAEFDTRVKIHGDSEETVRGVLLHLSNHTAEHLGQLIAYARMNGVAPPWSE